MLEVSEVDAFYGDFHVLHRVSLNVREGEVVALVGQNGHGKSTLCKTICGLLAPRAGHIAFDGAAVAGLSAPALVRRGLVYVAEDRRLFPDMTVMENLELGAFVRHARARRARNLEMVFDLYPRLAERRGQIARTLSGGEAQMLALGRGLMSDARMIAIDEPSLGLAPNLAEQMFRTIERIAATGKTILLVEQNESALTGFVSRIYHLLEGAVVDERQVGTAGAE